MGDLLDFYSQDYGNKVILGDFNLEPFNPRIASFMNNQTVKTILQTCLEGVLNRSWIRLGICLEDVLNMFYEDV